MSIWSSIGASRPDPDVWASEEPDPGTYAEKYVVGVATAYGEPESGGMDDGWPIRLSVMECERVEGERFAQAVHPGLDVEVFLKPSAAEALFLDLAEALYWNAHKDRRQARREYLLKVLAYRLPR